MLSLLNPLFFYVMGTIGVLVPLALHLIQRRQSVKVPFPTIRFLKLAQARSSSQIRLQNILLWILRTLLLVTLALAFAMPMWRGRVGGSWLGRSPHDVAIVIDGSYSMDYSVGRATVWQQALDTAASIVEGLGEQDRFCIFVAGDHVEPVIEQLIGDKDEGITRIKALELSNGSCQLAPAVMAANAALEEADGRREREIHVITDGQSLAWKEFYAEGSEEAGGAADAETDDETATDTAGTEAMGAWDPDKIDQKLTTMFVALLGVDKPENVYPSSLKIQPSLLPANTPSTVTVTMGYSGPPRSTTLTLKLNGEEVATRSTPLSDTQGAKLGFVLPGLPVGWHHLEVKPPEDNLMLDNAFYAVLNVKDRFPALCVGSRRDSLFLRTALKAGQGGGIEADWVEPGNIDVSKLSKYSCVFLCNALPLGASETRALQAFASKGGLVVVFPGNRASPADYQSMECLPAFPTTIESVPMNQRKQILHWDAGQHAMLGTLRLGNATLSATAKQRLTIDELQGGAETIIMHGNAPFLIGRPRDQGYVLLFTVSADRSWSDFPLSPFYLPIIHQIVEFGAGVGAHPPFVWCTRDLPVDRLLPEATHATTLKAPNGRDAALRSAMAGNETTLFIEDLTTPGVYRMTPPDGSTPEPRLAVNVIRKESDLTPVAPTELTDLIKLENLVVVQSAEEHLESIQESRIGRTFGEQLLWLVLILAVAEFVVANRLTQEAPSLTGMLSMDASGKLPSVAAALEKGGSSG